MRNLIFISVTAIILMVVYAFKNPKVDFNDNLKGGIQFHKGTWEEALQLAKKENKLIFLDIYSTWCGPCKQLKKYTFSNTEVGTFYNQNFINVAFDGEQGEGVMLAQKDHLTSYPSLFFIDGNGRIVDQTGGYYKANELISLGQKFIKH